MNAKIKQHIAAMFAAVTTTAAITGSVLGGFNAVAMNEEASAVSSTSIIANESGTKVLVTAKRA